MPRPLTFWDLWRLRLTRWKRWLFGRRRPRPRERRPKRPRLFASWWSAPGGVMPVWTWAGFVELPYRLLVSPTGIAWQQARTLSAYERVHAGRDFEIN